MTEPTIKMWGTWADPREVFLWAFFHRHPDAREELIAAFIELADDADDDARERVVLEWRDRWALPPSAWVLVEAIRVATKSLPQPPAQWESTRPEPPSYTPRPWTPQTTSRPDYEKTDDIEYQIWRAGHLDETEVSMQADAFMSPNEKRQPQHFIWAVMYFVDGLSEDEIAKEANITQQEVSAAVRGIARRIGMEMRKRGRPKKIAGENTI